MRREGRSRFIQYQNPRLQRESLGDLYQLLFSNGESLYRCMELSETSRDASN